MMSLAARRRLPRSVQIGAVAVVVAVLVLTLPRLLFGEGELQYRGVPTLRLPVPPVSGTPRSGDRGNGESTVAASAPGAPAPIDPVLLEHGTYGAVPRVGSDGRRPAIAYARSFDPADTRPRIGILVLGLGRQADRTEEALSLPAPVSLQFSPYAPDLPTLLERARQSGHEVILGLPMEPLDFPESDPGPHTLLAEASIGTNLDRLHWILARAAGYFGVSGSGRRFARSAQAEPILRALAERGLALVEIGTQELASLAAEVDLLYAHARGPIDADPSALAIDAALAELERRARQTGSAIGAARPYPISFERLALWIASLADKGIALAPVSAVMIEQSDPDVTRRRNGFELALPQSG